MDRSFFNNAEDDWETESNTFLMLLGIHAGQYPEKIEARKVKRTQAESDDVIRDRDKLRIPSSMAVVVPSWEIPNLLELPIFKEQRDMRNNRIRAENENRNKVEPEATESTSVDRGPSPPANDENPTHR